MTTKDFQAIPSGQPLCAEIRGVDLNQDIDGATFELIHKALDEY
jgi:hypothetical protein